MLRCWRMGRCFVQLGSLAVVLMTGERLMAIQWLQGGRGATIDMADMAMARDISQAKHAHKETNTKSMCKTHIQNASRLCKRIQRMNIMAIDLSLKKFYTHLSSLHRDKANFQAEHPSQRAKRWLIYSSVTRGKKTGVGLDAHTRIVVIAMWLLGCRE